MPNDEETILISTRDWSDDIKKSYDAGVEDQKKVMERFHPTRVGEILTAFCLGMLVALVIVLVLQ